jgi:TolA-binding protein
MAIWALLAGLLVVIPITAIVGGLISEGVKTWTRHREEMARIRASATSGLGETAQSQFELLRNELMALRDTTTQYDMSVEKSLEEIRHRLTTLESRSGHMHKPQVAPETATAIVTPGARSARGS